LGPRYFWSRAAVLKGDTVSWRPKETNHIELVGLP
jgi:hypothetical protein